MTRQERRSVGPRIRRLRSGALGLAAGVGAVVALAACGSSSGSAGASGPSTGAQSSTGATTSTSGGATAAANTFLAPYDTAPVTWRGPTTKDPVAKGKHIVYINVAPTDADAQTISAATKQVAATLHWTVTEIDDQNINDFTQSVQQAINLHPDGITFDFEDADLDPAAFKALAASHIPVVTFGLSTDAVNSANPGITHIVNVNYPLQGELTAAAAVKLDNGDAKIGLFTLPHNSEAADTTSGIASYFKQHGGGSIVATHDIDLQSVFNPTAVGQAAVAFVEAHPSINQLWVVFDGVAAEVIPALTQAHLKVKVLSAEGDAYNIHQIRTGGLEDGDTTWPYQWATYATFDDFNRIFDKLALPKDDGIPVREFYPSDVYSGAGYWNGDYDFASKYKTLWGIG